MYCHDMGVVHKVTKSEKFKVPRFEEVVVGYVFASNNICDYASAAKQSEVFMKQRGSMGMEALANLN